MCFQCGLRIYEVKWTYEVQIMLYSSIKWNSHLEWASSVKLINLMPLFSCMVYGVAL